MPDPHWSQIAVVLGERVTGPMLLGVAMLLAGVVLMNVHRPKRVPVATAC